MNELILNTLGHYPAASVAVVGAALLALILIGGLIEGRELERRFDSAKNKPKV